MQTFAQWVAQIKTAFQGGTPSRAQLLMAVKDGVSGIMARDIESDLALAKSYSDRFQRAKLLFAGTRLTGTVPTIISEIRPLIPIAADTTASGAALDHAITVIADEINRLADKFDAYIIEAAIELQRHVPFYCARQLTSYRKAGAGVYTEGFISRVVLPLDTRVKQVWYGRYYPALEEGVEIEAGDIVVSNGRLYVAITAGAPSIYDVATGLLTTDGTEEVLGGMSFSFYRGARDWPVRPLEWTRRQAMRSGQIGGGPVYSMPEEQDTLWFYPALDENHRFDVEYVGVAQTFANSDTVTFDKIAAKAAAHYVKGMLQQTEENDARAAGVSLTLYQRAIREAVLDCQDREVGPSAHTVPYDWSRNPMVYGSPVEPFTTAYPNDYASWVNSSGNIELESSAANMVVDLLVIGVARISQVILKTPARAAGDRIIILMTLPEVIGISFEFLNGTTFGSQLLPVAPEFPAQRFTTDGTKLSASFEFEFDGTAWEFVNFRSPV